MIDLCWNWALFWPITMFRPEEQLKYRYFSKMRRYRVQSLKSKDVKGQKFIFQNDCKFVYHFWSKIVVDVVEMIGVQKTKKYLFYHKKGLPWTWRSLIGTYMYIDNLIMKIGRKIATRSHLFILLYFLWAIKSAEFGLGFLWRKDSAD